MKFLFISSFFVCCTVSDETFPFRYACKKLYHDLQTYLFDLKSPFIHPILCLRKVYLSPDLRLHMPKKIILKHFAIAVVSPECLPLPAGSKTCLMLSTKRNFLPAVFSSYLRPKNDQSKLSEWAISSECKQKHAKQRASLGAKCCGANLPRCKNRAREKTIII